MTALEIKFRTEKDIIDSFETNTLLILKVPAETLLSSEFKPHSGSRYEDLTWYRIHTDYGMYHRTRNVITESLCLNIKEENIIEKIKSFIQSNKLDIQRIYYEKPEDEDLFLDIIDSYDNLKYEIQ